VDAKRIDVWSDAVDRAEQFQLTLGLPDNLPAGTLYHQQATDQQAQRLWQRIDVVSGPAGGRWAYWQSWKDDKGNPGIGPHPEFKAIADTLFNGDAVHFIGMLGIPYPRVPGTSSLQWVLIEPRMTGSNRGIMEEKPNERYEKSNEVFDLGTQTTTKL